MKYTILFLFLLGCAGDQLPKYALVNNLRVLGLKAATPEISPGGTIGVVSALVLDPDGGGRTITYEWVGCLETTTSSTTRYTCENATDRVSLGSGSSSTGGVVTIPATALDNFSTSRAFNGINYIVAVTVTAGSETIRAFKRIVISTNPTKNSNPTISGIIRAGATLANGNSMGTATDLTADISNASYETYTYKDSGGTSQTSQEDILITWFYTEGSMDVSRTFGRNHLNHWIPPTTKQRTNVTLAIVINDGRGGIDWQSVNLQ